MRLLAGLCLAFFSACGSTPSAVCNSQMCSGHGQCVISPAAPTTALCRCDPGFEPHGLECLASTDGGSLTCGPGTFAQGGVCVGEPALCGGTACGAHGHCEVRQSAPWCACDEGFVATAQPDGTMVCRPSRCLNASTCSAGQVCSRSTGTCVTPSCGLPPAETRTAQLGTLCIRVGDCAPGLTCVPGIDPRLTDGGVPGRSLSWSGVCARACDPCTPSCGTGETCVALEQGGFCTTGLAQFGERCQGFSPGALNPDRFTPCVGGAYCPQNQDRVASCVAACSPPPGYTPNLLQPFESTDCQRGELCRVIATGVDGTYSACFRGVLSMATLGTTCDSRTAPCQSPLVCATSAIHTCGPAPMADGDGGQVQCTGTTCGDGVPCIAGACVADGAKNALEFCLESRNCAGGLRCIRSQCVP